MNELFDKHVSDETDSNLIGHTDPTLTDEELPRLGGQNGLVLTRLRSGPATNIQLETYSGSRRVNSRIADVRRFLRRSEKSDVVCRAVDIKSGIFQYEIIPFHLNEAPRCDHAGWKKLIGGRFVCGRCANDQRSAAERGGQTTGARASNER